MAKEFFGRKREFCVDNINKVLFTGPHLIILPILRTERLAGAANFGVKEEEPRTGGHYASAEDRTREWW